MLSHLSPDCTTRLWHNNILMQVCIKGKGEKLFLSVSYFSKLKQVIGVPSNHGVEYFRGSVSSRMFAVDGLVFGVCQKMSKKSKEVEKS